MEKSLQERIALIRGSHFSALPHLVQRQKRMLRCLAAFALSAAAQAAVVQGVILDEESGNPLARTVVTLAPLPGTQASAVSVRTGERGSYLILSVKPGWYVVRATRRGFADTEAGQLRPGLPGRAFQIEGNDESRFVQIVMRRLAAVTGSVLDENGIGIPDWPVHVYTAATPIKRLSDGKTDDRGNFRIGSLEPAAYIFRSGPGLLDDESSLLPTFYKSGTEVANAQPTRLRLGETVPDILIRPVKGKLFDLSGTFVIGNIRGNTGQAQLTLITDTGRRVIASGPGTFSARNVPPGSAALLAEGPGCGGYQQVVMDRDQSGVTAVCGPVLPPLISIVSDLPRTAVRPPLLARRTDLDGAGETRTLNAREHLVPGLWEFSMQPGPQFFVASIENRTGGPSTSRGDGWFALEIANLTQITVTLSSRVASISGLVTTGGRPVAGAPVYQELYDPTLPVPRLRLWSARTDPEGRYKFEGLASGRYRLSSDFALDPEDPFAMDKAAVVILREGDKALQPLEMMLP